MADLPVVAQVVSGTFGDLFLRQKHENELEIGDLLVTEVPRGYQLLQVQDLAFGSQMRERMLQFVAGMKLEEAPTDLGFMDEALSTYVLASVRSVLTVAEGIPRLPKTLPGFMGAVRHASKEDFRFLLKPERPLFLGQIRSGSKILDVPVYLDGEQAMTHHILVPATTGRGKSNMVKVLLYS
ncbi:MAG: helicase HerA domain-containing protein, partial [Thermoplasmata archaeon]